MSTQDPWMLTYEDDSSAMTDERLAYELLCGTDMRLPNGQLGKQYPVPGSKHDQIARAALARLIRTGAPFPELIRETLAALFDPASATVPIERRIEFKRYAGRTESRLEAALEIAAHVWLRQQLGDKKEAAIASAMQQFGLKRRRVFDICRRHAHTFPKL
jgi:hypothetical protein